MSGDEVFALIASSIVGLWGWWQWLGGLFLLNSLSRKWASQVLAWLVPLLSAVVMLAVLGNLASSDVRNNPVYIFFYFMMWVGWTGVWNWLLPYLGLSCRDDALERDNTAAGLAITGGLLGVTLAFAGGNIGNGPGWWVVVFCGGIATASMLILWLMGNELTNVIETISIDRDLAAGWRSAGFFISAGLILGRAVAGDWHSAQQTIDDFLRQGWPVLIVWGIAVMMDRVFRPSPKRPCPNWALFGVLPCLLLIAFALFDLLLMGAW